MRTPSKPFVKALKRFDPALRCRWSAEPRILPPLIAKAEDCALVPGGVGKGPANRWVIERWNCKSGLNEHIMYVIGKDGEYREPGESTIALLSETDTWKHFGPEWKKWNDYGRKAHMNKLGLKEDESDPFPERWGEAAEHRYYQPDKIAEMAGRLRAAIKKDLGIDIPAEQMKLVDKRMQIEAEVAEAYELGEGRIEWDPQLQCARRVE